MNVGHQKSREKMTGLQQVHCFAGKATVGKTKSLHLEVQHCVGYCALLLWRRSEHLYISELSSGIWEQGSGSCLLFRRQQFISETHNAEELHFPEKTQESEHQKEEGENQTDDD